MLTLEVIDSSVFDKPFGQDLILSSAAELYLMTSNVTISVFVSFSLVID